MIALTCKRLHTVTLFCEEIEEYEIAFNTYDVNKDGHISVDELSALLQGVGLKPSKEELMMMIKSVDNDNDGVLSISEFIKLMSHQHNPLVTPQSQFKAVFNVFDRDGRGYITSDAFKDTLSSIGQRFSEVELDVVFNSVKKKNKDIINKREFLAIFNSSPHPSRF